MGNKHKPRHPKASGLQDECIRVPKVYDWVTDSLTVKKELRFTDEQLEDIKCALDDPSRRPLRIVVTTPTVPPLFPISGSDSSSLKDKHFFCEQVGDKRDVTVPISGEFVDAELVDLLFTANVIIKVVDRHGEVVTKIKTDVTALESFVLCYPDGTDLFCRVSKIFSKLSSGSLILNAPGPSRVKFEVTFCVDVQVEAEVKLEVLAKFCAPRGNDIEPIENPDGNCPPIEFPKQCPDIFPGKPCEAKAKGEASGETESDATEEGVAGILFDICPGGNLSNSKFEFTFDDRSREDGLKSFNFVATEFDPDTLELVEVKGGVKLLVSGEGKTDHGDELDFNLALLQSKYGDKFQVQLIKENSGRKVFDTGVVDVTEGAIVIDDSETADLSF
ncbi:hypothetical protein [Terrilactibacillus laevilacticus]|uniref:hypothetical protein n=1 Tax=Terrilactibacillus laevilacticus TaxID=1380157 RepID=UPI001147954A|nr:hypothetical protein [Terrilactibacillus laevilacticus]